MNEGKLNPGKIICAVRSDEDFASALISKPKVIFDLSPDISDIRKKAEASHKKARSFSSTSTLRQASERIKAVFCTQRSAESTASSAHAAV